MIGWNKAINALCVCLCLTGTPVASLARSEFIIAHSWNGTPLPAEQISKISAKWLASGDLAISITAPFANDPRPQCQHASCWQLWEHEVVELFLVGEGSPAPYTEIEISPWGYYLVLQFAGIRKLVRKHIPLHLHVSRQEKYWQARARLSALYLPAGMLKVNAYRITGQPPQRQYQAMTPLTSNKPDFHLVEQFQRSFPPALRPNQQ